MTSVNDSRRTSKSNPRPFHHFSENLPFLCRRRLSVAKDSISSQTRVPHCSLGTKRLGLLTGHKKVGPYFWETRSHRYVEIYINNKRPHKILSMQILIASTLLSWLCITSADASGLPTIPDPGNIYTYPAEDTIEHEATWLQWPHNYGWDPIHQERYEPIWLEMTLALHSGEKVHIVAYDENHRQGIEDILVTNGADMNQIRFFVYKTDDVWTRDVGPLYVFDQHGNRIIEDLKFNGWVSSIIEMMWPFSFPGID